MRESVLGVLFSIALSNSIAQTNVVYDIHKDNRGSAFYYPGDDGKPARAMAGRGFLVPHKEAPLLKRGSYKDICWGALPAEWVVNYSEGIFIIPSGEPLNKCWKHAPKEVQTAVTPK